MNRHKELLLVTLLLLLAAVLRLWDLSRLPPGFSNEELAHIRLTETVHAGTIAVYYQVGDGHGRAGMYAVGNALATTLVGDGLLGYRAFSVGGGLLALALLYAFARRLFGPAVALIALGVMTVNLRAILLSRLALSEAWVPAYTLVTLLCLAVAFNLRRTIHFRAPATLWFTLLAMLFGAAGYLHYTLLVLGPICALFFAHLLITRQPISRRMWNVMIFVVVLATVVALPYLISSLRHPSASEPYVVYAQRPQSVGDLVDGLLRAIGGVIWRGDPDPASNRPGAALVGPLMAILLLIGVGAALRRWRDPAYALLLLVLLAGVLTDAWVGRGPDFSANLVALPAVMILPAIGVLALVRSLHGRGVASAWQPVALALLAILLVNVITLRSRLFESWPRRADVAQAFHAPIGRLAAYLDRTPDGLPVSMCSIPLREINEVGLSTRQMLQLMLHRETIPIRHSDCRGGLVLINAGAPMRFVFLNPDDRRQMPPELADWIKEGKPIHVKGLPDGTVLEVDVEQRVRDSGGFWNAYATTYFMPGASRRPEKAELPVTLERNLTFAGYDPRVMEGTRQPGGDPIVLATFWRVDGPLPPDLGIFAQVLAYPNPLLQPLAEANTIDVIPAELHNRDFFIQVSYIWPSDSVSPGDYALTVGAYTNVVAVLDNHVRVVDRDNGRTRGDRLLLGTIVMALPDDAEDTPAP